MAMTPEETTAVEQLQSAAKKMYDLADKQQEDLKKFGEIRGEWQAEQQKLNDRIDQLETKLMRPPSGKVAGEVDDSVEMKKQVKSFYNLVRKGDNALKEMTPDEQKSFVSNDDPNGGYTMPQPTQGKIIELAMSLSPVRSLASVESITGDTWECPRELALLDVDEKAETEAPSETTTEDAADWLGMEKINTHEMYASPYITQKLLDDSAYDIESFIVNRIGRVFGKKEGYWFTNGNNATQAEGLMVNANIPHYHNGSATVIQADALIAFVYSLHEYYEKNASFLMKRATVGLIRALKDAVTGTYVWQPAFAAGEPPTILGYPVYQDANMPAVGAGTYPILFGDFKAGYKIVDRKSLTILRDPYSHKPYIQLYATRRVGGSVVDYNAFTKLYMAI